MIIQKSTKGQEYRPISINDYLEKIPDQMCSDQMLASLWHCLQTLQYVGYSYYCLTGKSQCINHGYGYQSALTSREAASVYDNVFRRFNKSELLTRRIIRAEKFTGSYVVCPVFGPYTQNAIFILHTPQPVEDFNDDLLWKLELILQKTHVAIVENKAKIWEKRLSLSNREEEILTLMSTGLSNRAIAQDLNISIHTINAYVRRIFLKLGSNDRVTACRIGLTIPSVANNSGKPPAKIHHSANSELLVAC